MTNMRHEIQRLAAEFAESIVTKLQKSFMEDFLGGRGLPSTKMHLNGSASTPLPTGSGRPGRPKKSGRLNRSAVEIHELSNKIVELLSKNKEGMRSEEIREALSIERREFQKPVAIAIDEGRLSKSGEKRATVYMAVESARGASKSTGSKNGIGNGKAEAKGKSKPAKKTKAKKTKAKAASKSSKKAKPAKKKGKKPVERDSDSMPPSPLEEGEDSSSEDELENDSA